VCEKRVPVATRPASAARISGRERVSKLRSPGKRGWVSTTAAPVRSTTSSRSFDRTAYADAIRATGASDPPEASAGPASEARETASRSTLVSSARRSLRA
jgi:hypothetical protein